MSKPRQLPETLADYAAVAISPVLVTMLVCSLVFFLTSIFYQGEFVGRLNFVMTMFVMGSVCVARISMEESAAYAAPFGGALGLVVFIAMQRFVEFTGPLASLSPVINFFLMFIVWWSANQLTWDCTLLDRRRDTTGQGLLKKMWPVASAPNEREVQAGSAEAVAQKPSLIEDESKQPHWWQKWFSMGTKVHTPGLWVAYFTFAALPLFGIGNLFLGTQTLEVRRQVFRMLVVYVASALGLLVLTSFLNIRRYLRQRNLEMPGSMTAKWLGFGIAGALGILAFCMLLPRRNPEYSVTHLKWANVQMISPSGHKSSNMSVGTEGTKEKSASGVAPKPDSPSGENKEPAKQQQAESSSSKKSDSQGADAAKGEKGTAAGKGSLDKGGEKGDSGSDGKGKDSQSGKQSNEKGTGGEKGKQGSGNKSGDKGKDGDKGSLGDKEKSEGGKSLEGDKNKQPQEKSAEEQSTNKNKAEEKEPAKSNSATNPPPASTPPPSPAPTPIKLPPFTIGNALQWLFYLLFAIVALVLAYIYREVLWAAWKQFLQEFAEFWNSLWGNKRSVKEQALSPVVASTAPRKRFRDYASPFSGNTCTMQPNALVRYEFEALEAWGADRGLPRKVEQTPMEYVEQLALKFPGMAQGLQMLGDLYAQVAYAKRNVPANPSVSILGQLWQQLHSN